VNFDHFGGIAVLFTTDVKIQHKPARWHLVLQGLQVFTDQVSTIIFVWHKLVSSLTQTHFEMQVPEPYH